MRAHVRRVGRVYIRFICANSMNSTSVLFSFIVNINGKYINE